MRSRVEQQKKSYFQISKFRDLESSYLFHALSFEFSFFGGLAVLHSHHNAQKDFRELLETIQTKANNNYHYYTIPLLNSIIYKLQVSQKPRLHLALF